MTKKYLELEWTVKLTATIVVDTDLNPHKSPRRPGRSRPAPTGRGSYSGRRPGPRSRRSRAPGCRPRPAGSGCPS
jgi:hypothetical protein